MRTVRTFWQTPTDETAFFEYLSKGDVIVYPPGPCETEEEMAPISLSDYLRERTGGDCFLSLRTLHDEVKSHKVEHQGKRVFGINPTTNSVVGYSPGLLENGTLTITNIAAFWDMERDGAVVMKSHEFCKWGKGIFKWLGKRIKPLQEGARFPMTDAAKEAARGGVSLVEFKI